jgi:hypothetical protein
MIMKLYIIKMNVGFEVLTAVVIKNYIFWDMMLCSPLTFNGLQDFIPQKMVLFLKRKFNFI